MKDEINHCWINQCIMAYQDNIFYGIFVISLEENKNNTNFRYITYCEMDTKASKQLWNRTNFIGMYLYTLGMGLAF